MLGKHSKHIIPNGGEKMGDESDGIPIRKKSSNKNVSKQGTDGHLKDLKSQTFQHTWQVSKMKGAPGGRWDKGIGAYCQKWDFCQT